jgi:hypothetical protein
MPPPFRRWHSSIQEDLLNTNHDTRPDDMADQPSADLSHLHPDNVRLGSVGVFAGDWAWTGNPPRIPVGFVGTLIDRWNGWAVFRCTREVAEAIAADQESMRDTERARLTDDSITGDDLHRRVDEAVPPMWFDGDDLICDETAKHGEGAVDRLSAGEDGRYCVKGFDWCWTAVDPADCDSIAGVLPAFGEHREFVYAAHEPLRMPHDRLTAGPVEYLNTHTGVAFTAALLLDGAPVGTIENSGRGGTTMFRPSTAAFGRAQLEQFVAGCRWRGQSADEVQVLESLITEYETNLQIAASAAEGLAQIVLRDGDGRIVAAEYGLDQHQLGRRGLRDLARRLTESEVDRYPQLTQFVWEVWTGERWTLMDIVDLPRGSGPAGER